jgi:hypothetical protein
MVLTYFVLKHVFKKILRIGATYDLQPLEITNDKALSYHIFDGDIPCTPEHEPKFSFAWNFCHRVTNASEPLHWNGGNICRDDQKGAAIQFIKRKSDDYTECHVIGRYDESNENSEFSLISSSDPSKGVSMKYPYGEKCPHGVLRSATIDVQCANVKVEVDSAQEPNKCQYHMVMKSWHGCPLECPVTDAGLCSSHGHCAYDQYARAPYCYCNEGYVGADCSQTQAEILHSSFYYKLQIFLLIILLLVCVLLIYIVIQMVGKVKQYRNDTIMDYSRLDGSEHEVSFSQETEMSSSFNNY